MKKVLFIDRDGTLIVEPPENPQIDRLEALEFIPGVFRWLGQIARETDFELVMVSNQDGLGTDSFPESVFWPVQNKIIRTLEGEGIRFANIHIDGSMPHENKDTRKPGTGMLASYFGAGYDLKNSFVIGDRITDIQLAKNLGAQGILLTTKDLSAPLREAGLNDSCRLVTDNWQHIYEMVRPPAYGRSAPQDKGNRHPCAPQSGRHRPSDDPYRAGIF